MHIYIKRSCYQKNRKGSRETNDLLYIDRTVIKEVKSRNKNLAMGWIDYKKAYDMVKE